MQSIRLTIKESAASIHRQFGGRLVPDWRLRRLVDVLENQGTLEVQRIGTYRTISADDLGILAGELQRLGLLAPKPRYTPRATNALQLPQASSARSNRVS